MRIVSLTPEISMHPKTLSRNSKFLSLVLRHRPEVIDIRLDAQGWVEVDELLNQMAANNRPLTFEELSHIVAHNNKKRFAFNESKTHIRASQGHSIQVDLGYKEQEAPELLFHGTAKQFIPSIQQKGLMKQNRHHVHLSLDEDTARNVGGRHGKAVILQVKSREMQQAGHSFFLSENGVWLTETVPVPYIIFPI